MHEPNNTLPYSSFYHVQQHVEGVEAIDYFFAKEMLESVPCSFLSSSSLSVFFHLKLSAKCRLARWSYMLAYLRGRSTKDKFYNRRKCQIK